MGWADAYIKKLQNGETVQFRPFGNSMSPKINSGQTVTVIPVKLKDEIIVNDIVLCLVNSDQYLHLIKEIKYGLDTQYLIGNNKGRINGWITKDKIWGKVVSVK